MPVLRRALLLPRVRVRLVPMWQTRMPLQLTQWQMPQRPKMNWSNWLRR